MSRTLAHPAKACPNCLFQDTDTCDSEVIGDEVHVYMECPDCGTTWTGVYYWVDDIDEEVPERDTTADEDASQRAADMNATLRDIGGTQL